MYRFAMQLNCLFFLALSFIGTVGAEDCFNSTYAILVAQIADTSNSLSEIVLCPNTTIVVGAPTSVNFTSFNNDFPLGIVKPNLTFKCGADGSRSNNCVIQGSGAVFLVLALLDIAAFDLYNVDISNTTIKGLQFTGSFGDFRLYSRVVTMAANGQNVVFDDCAFKSLRTPYSVIDLGSSAFESAADVPKGGLSVTVKNSAFSDIEFESTILTSTRQALSIENCTFEDINFIGAGSFNSSLPGCDCNVTKRPAGAGVFFRAIAATCIFEDCSLVDARLAQAVFQTVSDNTGYTDPSIKVINSNGSNITYVSLPENYDNYGLCEEGFADVYVNFNGTRNSTLTVLNRSIISCTDAFPITTNQTQQTSQARRRSDIVGLFSVLAFLAASVAMMII